LAEIAVESACSITTAFEVTGPVQAIFPDRLLTPVAELVTARVPGASDDSVHVNTTFEPGARVTGAGVGPASRLAPADPANMRVAEGCTRLAVVPPLLETVMQTRRVCGWCRT